MSAALGDRVRNLELGHVDHEHRLADVEATTARYVPVVDELALGARVADEVAARMAGNGGAMFKPWHKVAAALAGAAAIAAPARELVHLVHGLF